MFFSIFLCQSYRHLPVSLWYFISRIRMYIQASLQPLVPLACRGTKKRTYFSINESGPAALFRLDLNWSHALRY
jgi:hypothetical protein